MIESRYKIEYIVPEEDVKKTSPFRVLWYLLLIPLIAAAVVGITYNFSVKDIARDSNILFQKAKVHIFNLGDPATLAALEQKKEVKQPKEAELAQSVAIKPETKIANSSNDKTRMSKLSAKQERQLKTIQEQIAKNTELTANLNAISQRLVDEQLKNQSLNSRLEETEKDRLELEEEYYKSLEKTEAQTVVSKRPALTPEEKALGLIDRELPPVIPEVTETTTSPELPKAVESNKAPESAKEKITQQGDGKSETDKIIEAMANVNPIIDATDPVKPATIDKAVEAEEPKEIAGSKSGSDSDLPEDVVLNTEKVNSSETAEKEEPDNNQSLSAKVIQEKVVEPVSVEPIEATVSVDFNEEKTNAVKQDIKTVEKELEKIEAIIEESVEENLADSSEDKNEEKNKESLEETVVEKTAEKESVTTLAEEAKPKSETQPKEVSSVDAIIAAMQDVKSDVTENNSSKNEAAAKETSETAKQ